MSYLERAKRFLAELDAERDDSEVCLRVRPSGWWFVTSDGATVRLVEPSPPPGYIEGEWRTREMTTPSQDDPGADDVWGVIERKDGTEARTWWKERRRREAP